MFSPEEQREAFQSDRGIVGQSLVIVRCDR
jgi:hypothetical protein